MIAPKNTQITTKIAEHAKAQRLLWRLAREKIGFITPPQAVAFIVGGR
jgi:hypothetical protein